MAVTSTMSGGARIRLSGDKKLMAMFARLPKFVRARVLRPALMKGASPILAAARSAAPVGETGLLKKSIKARAAKRKARDTRLVVIGPTHMKRTFRRTKAGKLRGVGKKSIAKFKAEGATLVHVDPGNYGHLVERGRVAVTPTEKRIMRTPEGVFIGKRARAVPARPFMRPAFQQSGRAFRLITERLKKNIKEEAAKFRRRRG